MSALMDRKLKRVSERLVIELSIDAKEEITYSIELPTDQATANERYPRAVKNNNRFNLAACARAENAVLLFVGYCTVWIYQRLTITNGCTSKTSSQDPALTAHSTTIYNCSVPITSQEKSITDREVAMVSAADEAALNER